MRKEKKVRKKEKKEEKLICPGFDTLIHVLSFVLFILGKCSFVFRLVPQLVHPRPILSFV